MIIYCLGLGGILPVSRFANVPVPGLPLSDINPKRYMASKFDNVCFPKACPNKGAGTVGSGGVKQYTPY